MGWNKGLAVQQADGHEHASRYPLQTFPCPTLLLVHPAPPPPSPTHRPECMACTPPGL